jgi:hypothetical protein
MTDCEAKKMIDKVFDDIMKVESISNLLCIIKQYPLMNNNQVDAEKYPFLELTLTPSEISSLKKKGILDEKQGVLTKALAVKVNKLTPLEKLLYSIIWKNGDLGKERHIVDGIESVTKKKWIGF